MSGRVAKNTTATVAAALMGTSHLSRGCVTHVNHVDSCGAEDSSSVTLRQVVRQDRERLLAPAAPGDVRVESGLFPGRQPAF